MPQKTLRFKIHQDGRVEETVEGFTGTSCNDATKNLENALGKVTVKNKTSFTKIAKEVAKNLDVVSNRKFVAKVLREEKTVSELKNKLPYLF